MSTISDYENDLLNAIVPPVDFDSDMVDKSNENNKIKQLMLDWNDL